MLRETLTRVALRRAAGQFSVGQSTRRLATATRAAAAAASSSSSPSSSSSSSSPSSASTWKPPIAPGVEPAYDEAIKLFSERQAAMRQMIPEHKAEVERHQPGTQEHRDAEARLRSLQITSEINDPETRWRFTNDPTVSLAEPVFAHLREQAWRRTALPRLFERIQLMKVLPDAIPSIAPTVDLQVAFGQGTGIHDHGGEAGDVLAGCFVGAAKTVEPPTLTATPFHAEERFYTLAMVDLDAPYQETDRIGTKAHWLVHNIPLSLTQTHIDSAAADEVMPYLAPHPARGTPYHRYATVLLQQPAKIEPIAIKKLGDEEREHFTVQNLITRLDLTPAGIHFWRAVWTEESKDAISSVYANVLQIPEPHYRRPQQV